MTKNKRKTAAKKKKSQAPDNKNVIVAGLIAFVLFVLMIIFWISHGTYGAENNPSVTISCPKQAEPGNTVMCSINLNNSSGTTILSVNANYNLASGLTYNSFALDDTCQGDTCFEEYANTQKGFAVANTNGITSNKLIGKLALTIPSDAASGTKYKVGLKNIELSDNQYQMISVAETSVNIKIGTASSMCNGTGEYTSNQIIQRVAHSTTYSELKTCLKVTNATLVSHDSAAITDASIVRTGDIIKLSNGVELTISVLGDINGDGYVKVSDVSKLYRHVQKRDIITQEYILSAGDINNANGIKIADVSVLYRYVRNKIDSLEVVE